jgi:hypothetical protein
MSSGVPFPEIQFSSWRNDELSDPDGTRHLVSGHFAYTKLVGVGCVDSLVFPNLVLNVGENEPFTGSDVVVLNMSVPNFGELQASGLNAVYNMKLWIPTGSGSVLDDLPGVHLEFQTSGVWVPNLSLPSGAGQEFLRDLPSQFNVRRIDGQAELTSFNNDNVSEWIYMRMFVDAQLPVGTYGICGSGVLRPRLTFDFY